MPHMQLTSQNIKKFQAKILSWYQKNKRDLPWREIPTGISLQDRAYRILVSEVMSQQTQVARVIPKYIASLIAFPTVHELAKAKTADVLRLWSGLGYNRRALYVQKAAQIIVTTYHGEFPQDEKTLRTLPGIGEYTARAVLCFAFNNQLAVVDTNVKRVILTQFQISNIKYQIPNAQKMQKIADRLLPQGKAAEWNQALMDYSAMVLSSQKVPTQKQSKFIGSNRYYRGKIIKLLLEKKKVELKKLGMLLKKDFQKTEEAWLHGIIDGLIGDGLIKKTDTEIYL